MNHQLARFFSLLLAALPFLFLTADAWARAGGGKNGGGGIIGIILTPIIILYALFVNKKINERKQKVENVLALMAQHEPQWQKEKLLSFARDSFVRLQTAWGTQDLGLIKQHLHPILYANWESQILNHQANGIKNIMEGLSILDIRIVDAKNFSNDEMDEFTVCFDARAQDKTFKKDKLISNDKSKFREFWTFEWENGAWCLREVTEASGWKRFINSQLIYENNPHRRVS